MIQKTLKIIGWIIAGTVGFVVAVYLIILAINWRDRAPSAEAVQLAESFRNRPALADEDNAFVYAMGFGVAPADDPYQMGLKRLAWLYSSQFGHVDTTRDPLGKPFGYKAHRLPTVRNFVEACRHDDPGCADAFRGGDSVFEQWVASESWLLDRYQALVHHPGWRESLPFDVTAPIPWYGLIVDGQKLLLLDSKVLAEHGDYVGARNLLEEDLRFWRKVLESSDMLISKAVATAALNRDFELGDLILREIRPDKVMNAVPAGWDIPFSDSERSMRRPLAGEWTYMSSTLRNVGVASEGLRNDSVVSTGLTRLEMPLYRRQDSINKSAAYFWETTQLLSAPLDHYGDALNRAAVLTSKTRQAAFPPRSPYNMIGQLLTGIGAYDYGTYARRVADLEGVRRAALLAVTLRAANVRASGVGAAVSTSALHEPYHNRPFEWDEQKSAIVFRGLETGERSVHRIYY